MYKQPDINDVKQFWNDRPCNIRHSAKPVGTREYYDEVEAKKFTAEPHIISFSEFDSWQGKSVLEIGCGIGTMAINFARAGANYTGVDLSEASVDLTRRRFEVYGLSGRFYSGNAEELSSWLPVERYDLVYSWGVIHHAPHPERIVDQIPQYLKDDGIFKMMVYSTNSWKTFLIEAGLDQPEAQYGCPIALTYTQDQIRDWLGNRFEILDIHQDHIFPYQIEPYKRGEYQLQPWFEAMPPEMFRVLEKNLGWHTMVTSRLK